MSVCFVSLTRRLSSRYWTLMSFFVYFPLILLAKNISSFFSIFWVSVLGFFEKVFWPISQVYFSCTVKAKNKRPKKISQTFINEGKKNLKCQHICYCFCYLLNNYFSNSVIFSIIFLLDMFEVEAKVFEFVIFIFSEIFSGNIELKQSVLWGKNSELKLCEF